MHHVCQMAGTGKVLAQLLCQIHLATIKQAMLVEALQQAWGCGAHLGEKPLQGGLAPGIEEIGKKLVQGKPVLLAGAQLVAIRAFGVAIGEMLPKRLPAGGVAMQQQRILQGRFGGVHLIVHKNIVDLHPQPRNPGAVKQLTRHMAEKPTV